MKPLVTTRSRSSASMRYFLFRATSSWSKSMYSATSPKKRASSALPWSCSRCRSFSVSSSSGTGGAAFPGVRAGKSPSKMEAFVAYLASKPLELPRACIRVGELGGESVTCAETTPLSCRKVLAPIGAVCRFLRRMKAMACKVSSAMRLPLSWQSTSEWLAWKCSSSTLPPSMPRSFQLRSMVVRVLFSRIISPRYLAQSGPSLLFRRSRFEMELLPLSTSQSACTPRSWLPMWFHFRQTLDMLLPPERSACASTTRPSALMLLPRRSIVRSSTFSRM
mmetsp:Transcript_54849/g.98795  ORF Transcript_54849/g.98795 Transcript_54849/m.98795 type:complete len:278 (-) Transcript_54849:232-1065(-)